MRSSILACGISGVDADFLLVMPRSLAWKTLENLGAQADHLRFNEEV